MGRTKHKLPFKVDRTMPGSLADQLAAGLRQAIGSGIYKPGDILPTLHDLAASCGTSLRVPREAMAELKKEGLVDPRRSLGCMVVGRRSSLWLGHVLFILCDASGSYYATVLADELQNRLTQAGYLFTRAAVLDKPGGFDDGALDAALAQNVTLAVLFCNRSSRVPRKLDRLGIPFVEIRSSRSELPMSRGLVRFSLGAALAEFVVRCRESGVKSVLQVCFKGECDIDAVPAFEAEGIRTRKEPFMVPSGHGRLEVIQRRSFKRFNDLLSDGWRPEEEVVFFTDDFLAMGALMAFVHAGVRIPEDVKVVSFANAGFGPVFVKPLTRLEMDPKEHGEAVVRWLLAVLRGETVPESAALLSVYREGATF